MSGEVLREGVDRPPWWEIVVDTVVELRPSRTSHEIGQEIEAALIKVGYLIVDSDGRQVVDEETAPEWAASLLDALFTGSRLDFGGMKVPPWLRHRLEAEYGMPVPTGDQATRHSSPVDLDDEEVSDLDALNAVHDSRSEA